MSRGLKRNLAVGVAVIALVSGGAIAAVSATGQDSPGGPARAHRGAAHRGAHRAARGALRTAAAYLGIPASQLRSELQSGKTLAQIANATSGKSEAGLIDALVAARKAKLAKAAANVAQGVKAEINRPLLARGQGRAGKQIAHAAAGQYLGLPAAQLRSELLSGKTLAQIADATPGKSQAGLVEAIVVARSRPLSAAVSAGKLSQAAESTRVAQITARVKATVNRSHAAKK